MADKYILDACALLAFFYREARRLKIKYKMSVADSIALGEASILGASILTSDHREFDPVEQSETIKFTWIR